MPFPNHMEHIGSPGNAEVELQRKKDLKLRKKITQIERVFFLNICGFFTNLLALSMVLNAVYIQYIYICMYVISDSKHCLG